MPRCLLEAGAYDLVFMDPPYGKDVREELSALSVLLSGVLVLEHEGETPEVPELDCVDMRQYGGTRISLFRGKDAGLS